MLITPAVIPTTIPERFDLNRVDLSGLVTRIWARSTGDIFARLLIGEIPDIDVVESTTGSVDAHLTLRLSNGQVAGQDISLLKGDALQASGYLSDITQWETLREYLLKARQTGLIERIPELAPAANAQVKRVLTCVIPETLTVLEPKLSPVKPYSAARVEGVVARVWEYAGHLFVRLAVYDQHTLITSTPGNHGRQRRIPHYLTIQFTNEQIDGRNVNLKIKDRIRVSGILGSRVYTESLRSFLLSARKADVLANLSDGQAPDEVWTAYVQTCLVAETLIQFTKR